MVAVIHEGRSLRAVINYNENKVQQQQATCIDAALYPLDADQLTYNQKVNRLQKLADLNTRAQVKTLHISLNFDPSEKLSDEKLQEITADYMNRIGFGTQPYLVYRHFDAGHPHCHIVTTNIKADGKAIPLHNLAKIQSSKARREIEIKYGLIKAEDQKSKVFQLKPVNDGKLTYGKSDTRRAIYNVLSGVLDSYKYTSLKELNAVLNLYNVSAETGKEGSRTHTHKGLLYRILDSDGNPVGVPIKASLLPENPGLKFLKKQFPVNDSLRQPHKARIKAIIDFALVNRGQASLDDMIKELHSKNVDTVVHRNSDGRIYGLTFVDHEKKCVWKGSNLGKQYGAKGIMERCKPVFEDNQISPRTQPDITENEKKSEHKKVGSSTNPIMVRPSKDIETGSEKGFLEELFKVEYGVSQLPYQWKKRRKKKKNQSNNL